MSNKMIQIKLGNIDNTVEYPTLSFKTFGEAVDYLQEARIQDAQDNEQISSDGKFYLDEKGGVIQETGFVEAETEEEEERKMRYEDMMTEQRFSYGEQ